MKLALSTRDRSTETGSAVRGLHLLAKSLVRRPAGGVCIIPALYND